MTVHVAFLRATPSRLIDRLARRIEDVVLAEPEDSGR
jgi:hypothetical protein